MSEKVNIHIGVPPVRQTKLLGSVGGPIQVRAETHASAFSVHYRQDHSAPTVGERLLVAVLSGVHDSWLPPARMSNPPQEEVQIDYRALSAEQYGGNDPSRAENIDVIHMTAVNRGDLKRLHLAMTNMSDSKVHAAVVLTKEQVTQMIAALLAIYPRLHED